MTFQTVSLVQGTPEWHAHRAKHFNASDAPAMMACSPYKTRADLIKERATGLTADVSPETQRRFDDGHRYEALARPLAEEFIGQELFPVVGVNGKYSASFDGITLMEDIAFEHKSLNNDLRQAMTEDCTGADLPLVYQVQMEHQIMVADSVEKVLFMASKWDGEDLIEERHCWYYPNPALRAKIAAGWEQLEQDIANYTPTEKAQQVVAEPMESLPAVVVQVNGSLTVGGNLDAFGDALRAFIDRIPSKPSTDQEFADAEAACKALKKAEDALSAAEDSALAQISDVELMRRTVADLKNLARTTRLAREKLVAAEKEKRRGEIVNGAQVALDNHVQMLNERLGARWLPRVAGGFAEIIKGKKSLANMEDAVAVALTSAKHDANQLAARLEANRKHLVQADGDWIALFADFSTVGTKEAEDFQILAAHRIGQHKQAEAARLEAQREQIRKEEAERLEREAAAKAKAEADEAERKRRDNEALAAQQAKAVIDAAAKTKCDGNHGGQPCGDHECWQLPAPANVLSAIEQQFQTVASAEQANSAPAIGAKPEGESLKLGQVNTMLKEQGLGQISAETLETNGIAFIKERGAVLIQASDVHRLLIKMAIGMRKLAEELAVSA